MTPSTARPAPPPLPVSPEIDLIKPIEHRPDCDEICTLAVNAMAAVEAGTKHLNHLEAERRARFNAD